jgi:hypothetical protein
MPEFVALQTQLLRLWWDNFEAGANAFVTIALRMPLLARENPTRRTAEAQRMIREKMAVLAEGSLAASKTVGLAPQDTLAIAEAFARPVHKRVKANAKRLMAKTLRP